MSTLHLTKGSRIPEGYFDGAVRRILSLQRDDGSIPWFAGGVFDPWNHTEAAMGLDVLGYREEAVKAYRHLIDTQLEDGSWWMQMGSAVPMDEEEQRYTGGDEEAGTYERDTNCAAYIATGLWHHYLLTEDRGFLEEFWPTLERAFHFIVDHQTEHGDIRWAARDTDTPDDALITASCSIHKSFEHSKDPENYAVAGQHLGILLIEAGVGLTVASVMVLVFYGFADAAGPINDEEW